MLTAIRNLTKKRERDGDAGTLRKEANWYAKRITRKLEQLGVCYRYRKSEKDLVERGVQRVKFRMAVTQDEAIWLMLDTMRLPRNVSLSSIDDPIILNDLSVACQRPVRFKRESDGAWLVVERESGVFGIRAVDYKDMVGAWPVNSKKVMLLPLGLSHNRRLVFRSLDDFPHALIGGATKSGKTTLMHGWICALAMHNPADLLKLVLIDLKGGVEFTRYKKLPHIWQYTQDDKTFEGFVKDRNQVVPILDILRDEMDKRLSMFERAGGVQNIAAWNYRHRKEPLPRLVVFIDELASLMLEPDLKKGAERDLADLGARGRAPGIHLVIGTQRPEVKVVSGRVKGNLDARFGFRVPDNASSMVIMDDASAAKFPESTPRGRYKYKFGNERREIQAPWIGPGKIRTIVNSIVSGDTVLQQEAARVDPDFVFRVALEQLGGVFSINKVFPLVRGKGVSRNYLIQLAQDYEGEIIDLDGELYELRAPAAEFEPRQLVRIGEEGPENDRNGNSETEGFAPAATQTGEPATQTPKAATQTETAIVKPATQPFTVDEALEYGLDHLAGELSTRKLYLQFRDRVKHKDLAALLKECDNTTVEIDGGLYFVEPGVGNRPRHLVEV